jgi:hypothetical protein
LIAFRQWHKKPFVVRTETPAGVKDKGFLNITDQDRRNQRRIADAVLRFYRLSNNGVRFRYVETISETHPIDFRMEWRFPDRWLPEFYFEVKSRATQYDPFKISANKLRTAYAIASREDVPLMLWVSFADVAMLRGLWVKKLDFLNTTIRHGKRDGNCEESFDIPIGRFEINLPSNEYMEHSPNSLR